MTEGTLDSWGEPVKVAKPGRDWPNPIVAGDRKVEYPIRGLDPDMLWARIMSAYDGDTCAIQETFEQMIASDGHLSNLDQRRRGALSGLKWDVKPYCDRPTHGNESPEPTPADYDLADYVSDVLFRIPDLQDHIKAMADAIGKGFSVVQIRWLQDGDTLRPYLRSIPQRLFTFRMRTSTDVITTQLPRLLTLEESTYGVDLDPMRYIVSLFRDRNVEPHRCGIMWSCVWFWLRKHEAWSQLMATGERFADPGLIGYINPDDMNSNVPGTVKSALAGYGPGAHAVIPGSGGPLGPDQHGAFISTPQADVRITSEFWKGVMAEADADVAKAWSGGNLVTDTRQGTGTYSAAKEQGSSEVETIRQPDFDWLAGSGVAQLIKLIVLVNKGAEAAKRLPTFYAPDLEPEEDQLTLANKFEVVGRTNWYGVRSVPPELREALSIPEMEEPEPEPEPEPTPGLPPAVPPTEAQPPVPPPTEEVEEEVTEEEAKAIAAYMDSPDLVLDARVERILAPVACGEILAGPASVDRELIKRVGSLVAKVDPYTDAAAENARMRVTAWLLRMRNAPSTPQEFQRAVLRHIRASYAGLQEELEGAGLGEWFEDTYKHYRLADFSAWPKGALPPGANIWSAADVRMSQHIAESPLWFFSKFTENATYRKPMQNFLVKEYAENGAQLFVRNEEIVGKFAKALGTTSKKLAGYEVDRIARTSVARAREEARLMQMYAAGVKQATVRCHPDACDLCAQYEGKAIDVESEVAWVEHMESLPPEKWEKAIKQSQREAMRGVAPHDFVHGGGGASLLYHPNCRCSMDVRY